MSPKPELEIVMLNILNYTLTDFCLLEGVDDVVTGLVFMIVMEKDRSL